MTISQDTFVNSSEKDLAKYTMAVAVMITGVAAHKIRRYEDYGLCKPARTGSKQRLYSDSDIKLIRQFTALEKAGVNLPGIKVILEMQRTPKIKEKGVK